MDLPDKTQPPAPQKPRVQPLKLNGVVEVKRPASRRFFNFIFAESPKDIGKRVLENVVVPNVKAGVLAAGKSFLEGMVYGNSAPPSGLQNQILRPGVMSYGGLVNQTPNMMALQASRPMGGNYQDRTFSSQEDAEFVLANLFSLLNQYRMVAIGDLNDMLGKSSAPSDSGYGWTSLEGSKISRVADGFLLELPRPTLIG